MNYHYDSYSKSHCITRDALRRGKAEINHGSSSTKLKVCYKKEKKNQNKTSTIRSGSDIYIHKSLKKNTYIKCID